MAKPLFGLPPARSSRAGDSKTLKKTKSKPKQSQGTVKRGTDLMSRINNAVALVEKNLGHKRDEFLCIRDVDTFIAYFDKAIEVGHIVIDTETSGLDPITDVIAGLCIYVPGEIPAYAPMNHVSYITQAPARDQIPDEVAAEQLQRIVDNKVFVDMFNAKFDMRMIKNYLGVRIKANHCGYVGARLLNELEPSNKLKPLHDKYCGGDGIKELTFGELFEDLNFTMVPINTAYLYAANDTVATYELNEFQRRYLDGVSEECIECDLVGTSFVFHEIEMPLIEVVAQMEDEGVTIDFEFAEELSNQYHAELDEAVERFNALCGNYAKQIEQYKAKVRANGEKQILEDPINIGSSKQIAVLLYDIFGLELPKRRSYKIKDRSTGAPALELLSHPVVDIIKEYRRLDKLLGTYVDKMPQAVNPKTNKVHGHFNQLGTKTGRFSSNDPNMQNIPSRNKEIRKMFKAADGNVFISADYSAQEPRITTHMCKDKKMLKAYQDGKDLYCEIASIAFKVPYGDCMEKWPDGTPNPEGKTRRSRAKAIVLGICYGKGVKAIGEDLGISTDLAKEIYDTVLFEFPGLKQFMHDCEQMAKETGYVTTIFGRKRRLPDIQLPKYEIKWKNGPQVVDFDPLDFGSEDELSTEVPEDIQKRYRQKMEKCFSAQDRARVHQMAAEEGITIKDNGGFIAQATRQCVNARIQGSAGDQIKMAMNLVARDDLLKQLECRIVLQVHDELIVECPKVNAESCAKRLKHLMEIAIKDYLLVPCVCDTEIADRWYGKEIEFEFYEDDDEGVA